MKKTNQNIAKKGQATLFIILGLILLILVGLASFFLFGGQEAIANLIETSDIGLDEKKANDNAKECISFYAEEGLKLIEAQGGHLNLRNGYITTNEINIGFFYEDGEVISLDKIENDLSTYIKDKALDNCFLSFSNYELELTEEIDLEFEFEEEELKITANWPIRFNRDEASFMVDEFGVTINTNFKQLYDSAILFVETPVQIDYEQQYLHFNNANVTVFEIDSGRIAYFEINNEYFLIAIEK